MISKSEFLRRRKRLMAVMEPNSIAIIYAANEKCRSRDTYYPYRQNSNVHYLSGFDEPEVVLAIIPGRKQGDFIIFCRDKDKSKELWDGFRAGPEGACKNYAASDAFPIGDIDEILPGLIEGKERVYYPMGEDQVWDQRVMSWVNSIRARVRSGSSPPGELMDLNHFINDLRLIKSAAELKLMSKSATIAAKAHCRAISSCLPGVFEYQLEAHILHEFAMNGARFPAYNSIVGSGKNGCVLHYDANDQALKDGDLVLIDAGCEYQYYASDITRTFPVNGKFSSPQKQLYELVLKAQLAAIEEVYPGNTWNAPHDRSVEVLTKGLVKLGLLKGRVPTLIKNEAYKEFYMHKIGHWLGMDVHDVGDYKIHEKWRVLEPGMVMTVEPGLYVSPDNTKVAKKWRGIGIRIEDDVAVTKDGHQVLSSGVPKTVNDIEDMMIKAKG